MSSRRKTKSSEQQLKTVKRLKRFVTTIEVIFWTTYSYDGCDFICAISKDSGCKGYGKHSNRPENYNLVGEITVTTRVYEILILMIAVSKLTNLNTIIQKNILILYCLV